MGALIRLVCEHLEEQRVERLSTRHGTVELRGKLVIVGDRQATLAPLSLALFRALLRAGGAVLSRGELMASQPDMQDDHAVDVAISRLRQSLPDARLVSTVIKRGYRISA
jgi:uroporphyrinogen-III synthase